MAGIPTPENHPAHDAQSLNWATRLEQAAVALDHAPGVAGFFASSAYAVQRDIHRDQAGVARAQRRNFLWEITAANVSLMATGVLSGLVLANKEVLGNWWLPCYSRLLGLATLALGAVAAMLTYRARENDRMQRWLNARSASEMARLSVFRQLAEVAVKGGVAEAQAGLDLTRRFLLDDQRAFLSWVGVQHRNSLDWTTGWGGLGMALAFVGGSGAVIASFDANQAWIAIAGIFAAALSAYALNREALRRDRVNADRYEKARAALDELAARADMVAGEIAAGRVEALTAYTEAIAGQLENEHRQWLDGATQAQALLAKFDEQIKGLGNPAP